MSFPRYNKKMAVRFLRRTGVYLITAWLFAVLFVASYQFPDPDLWGRLSIGALYFQNGAFPYHDPFSYTAPHALWFDHEWLTGMVFYQILEKTGETGFLLFKYGMILAIFATLFHLHRKTYKASPLYALYGLVATVSIYSVGLYATTRSHIFSFLFFVVFIACLERIRLGQQRPWTLLWLLPLGVLWANFHGGFIMGVILLGLYGLGQLLETRRLQTALPYWGSALAIPLLLALLNPYGPAYLSFLLHAWTLDRSHIGEWSTFRFSEWYFLGGQILWIVSMALLLLTWFLPKRNDTPARHTLITPTLIVLAMAAMTIKGVRFQPFLAWSVVAYAPILFSPSFWKQLLPQGLIQFGQTQQSAFQNTLPVLLLMSSLVGLGFLQAHVGLFKVTLCDEMTQGSKPQIRYPLGVIQLLRESPYHGNLVVRFGLGEFTYWALYPRFQVSMDGRYEEVYSQDEFLRNHIFYDKKEPLRSQQAVRQVTTSAADFILTEPNIPSTTILLNHPAWELLNGNDHYLLFGRVSSLKKFPPFNLNRPFLPFKTLSIQDFFTKDDLKRFQHANPKQANKP